MPNAEQDEFLTYEDTDRSGVRDATPVSEPVPIARIRSLVESAQGLKAPPRVYAHLTAVLRDDTYGEPGTDAYAITVERELEERFWDNVLREPSLRDFASEGPRAAAPNRSGTLELLTSTASTVRESLAVLGRFSEIVHGVAALSVVQRKNGGIAVLYHSPLPRDRAAAELAAEHTLFSVLESVRRNVGDVPVEPREVHLRGPAIAGTARLGQALRCKVHVGAASDRLELGPGVATLPLATASPAVHRAALRLARLEREALFRGRAAPNVRWALRDAVTPTGADDAGVALVESVAKILHTRPRTMQARLTAEGVSFRALVDDARRLTVERLLLAQTRPSEIQAALGYGDSASLRRSCRRWWGMGPTARARALGG